MKSRHFLPPTCNIRMAVTVDDRDDDDDRQMDEGQGLHSNPSDLLQIHKPP